MKRNQEAALAEMDCIIAAQLEQSGRHRLVQSLGRLPDPFATLRVLNRWVIRSSPCPGRNNSEETPCPGFWT